MVPGLRTLARRLRAATMRRAMSAPHIWKRISDHRKASGDGPMTRGAASLRARWNVMQVAMHSRARGWRRSEIEPDRDALNAPRSSEMVDQTGLRAISCASESSHRRPISRRSLNVRTGTL
jgi:predicted DNA-binding transcriptional regulator AlpA